MKRVVTYRDEAAFRRAERRMLDAGWRVERAQERPYRPLYGFLAFTGGAFESPRDTGTLDANLDHMLMRGTFYYAPMASPGCLDSLLSLILLPFYGLGLLASRALRPIRGSTRYDVLWVRDDIPGRRA